LLAPQAFAQAANQVGFSLSLNGNMSAASTELTTGGVGSKFTNNSQNAGVQGAYAMALGPNALLGLGASYSVSDLTYGSFTAGGVAAELKGRDMYALYVEPGYVISPAALVYGKLAYLGMKGEVTSAGVATSEVYDGVGYGIGFRVLLDKNFFVQIEAMQNDFNRKNTHFSAPGCQRGSLWAECPVRQSGAWNC
jgi:hypothetical protein